MNHQAHNRNEPNSEKYHRDALPAHPHVKPIERKVTTNYAHRYSSHREEYFEIPCRTRWHELMHEVVVDPKKEYSAECAAPEKCIDQEPCDREDSERMSKVFHGLGKTKVPVFSRALVVIVKRQIIRQFRGILYLVVTYHSGPPEYRP